jgi:hypothetical protein
MLRGEAELGALGLHREPYGLPRMSFNDMEVRRHL